MYSTRSHDDYADAQLLGFLRSLHMVGNANQQDLLNDDPSAFLSRGEPALDSARNQDAEQSTKRERLIQERMAQRTYRERQKRLLEGLGGEIARVMALNDQLASKVTSLESRLVGLQSEMRRHLELAHGVSIRDSSPEALVLAFRAEDKKATKDGKTSKR